MPVTPKLGLNLPQGSDLTVVQTAMNNQLATIDAELGAKEVFSSGDLPGSPYDGKLIYRVDQGGGLLQVYTTSGATYHTIGGRRRPRGKIGLQTDTAGGFNTGQNSETLFKSITWSSVVDSQRYYGARWALNLQEVTSNGNLGDNQIRIRMSTSTTVSSIDALIFWTWADIFDNNNNGFNKHHAGCFVFEEQPLPRPATRTMGLFIARTNGSSGTIKVAPGFNSFMVEDLGSDFAA